VHVSRLKICFKIDDFTRTSADPPTATTYSNIYARIKSTAKARPILASLTQIEKQQETGNARIQASLATGFGYLERQQQNHQADLQTTIAPSAGGIRTP
jgi:hypothetical protein